MRKLLIFLFPCIAIVSLSGQEIRFPGNIYSFIENPAVFELNQEEGHAPLVPYSSAEEALVNNRNASSGYISLNGEWKFYYSEIPEDVPPDFHTVGFNDRNWNTIKVPSNWEMEGYGDPMFRNVTTPFRSDPPFVPREYNPTGIYRRQFIIPPAWKGKEIFLRMEKTASASFVWINGKAVGYNEGAQEPAEYNITRYLKTGRNHAAIAVLKYSDGYYLEDQDYWRLSGIFDDIWLFAAPRVHIFDWTAITELDGDYTDAVLHLSFDVKNYSDQPRNDMAVKTTLYYSGKSTVKEITTEKFSLMPHEKLNVNVSESISNPDKWSAEHPNLYYLTFELLSASGIIEEAISGRIGFKETEIRNQVFYVNGSPVKLNAINSHMQHPVTGHAMDEATIRKDMEILKQFNINCVRTSHYPPAIKYLELADEYGLYVVDETGDEAHATEYLSERKEWEAMYRERARKMVLRDRNHPSVLFWSAGNESGEGDNICSVIEEGKKYDKTRYWMYGGNAFAHSCEDIIGPRYPLIHELLTKVLTVSPQDDPRPSFLDEYLALTGNGGGALDDYWEAFYNHPRSMGGALWDLISTGIAEREKTVDDQSTNDIKVNVMGRAKLANGISGKGIDLNGHDQWIEVYRDEALEVDGDRLTLSLWIYPRALNRNGGTLITKGNWQFGLHQPAKDSLEFYLTTQQKHRVGFLLPEDWENNWHHVTACYDGSAIWINVDGFESQHKPVTGHIRNTPFPVNIGRNAEIHGQETSVYICDAIIDQVGIFGNVLSPEILQNASLALKEKPLLWLDFEQINEGIEYFSYGIGARTYGAVWPDRKPQPEMWQIKKSAQPVKTSLVSADEGEIEIHNRYLFSNVKKLQTCWFLKSDNKIIQEGELNVDIEPGEKKIIKIPYSKPGPDKGKEYRLLVSYRLKNPEIWADRGFEIAWDQFYLPWSYMDGKKPALQVSELNVEETGGKLLIKGNDFEYSFNTKDGILESMISGGRELIKRGPVLNTWRAPLANETDEWTYQASNNKHYTEGYGRTAATEWYSSGIDRMKLHPEYFRWKKDAGSVIIEAGNVYTTRTGNGAFINRYRYKVGSDGLLTIENTIIPDGQMPAWLPRIGQEWILDKSLDQVSWYGRGPQENYPDRKSGYKVDIYESTVGKMYEPYLIPQDYGLRTDNRWVRMTDQAGSGMEFSGNELFNFNVHPFSTENLTRALYTFQLAPFDGLTLNIDYATSGVGCTAVGVFPQYQVMPKRYDFVLIVRLVR
ncbi:MAG: glycoside hydrolase family 2 TIM barrel-domain containing protein [Bacteroidales bacterium]|jgi:beta-galactosidase|nr:glycoside hydrolase family 2 TIM barrel-domain containing protein [Bacteroidales bacterium]